MAILRKGFFLFSLLSLPLVVHACPFSFGDNGEWKKEFGTPELLLENAMDEAYVYLYEDQGDYRDKGNLIKEAIVEAAPFTENQSHDIPKEVRYFTYQASWVASTSGPNYDRLSIWRNGFVRIDHKTSLGPHEYLYFSIEEAKAVRLVDFVFGAIPSLGA